MYWTLLHSRDSDFHPNAEVADSHDTSRIESIRKLGELLYFNTGALMAAKGGI